MTDPLFNLADQVAVITGGLGQLGQQFAGAVVERGGRVAIVDLSTDISCLSEPLAAARDAGKLMLLEGDVTSRGSLERSLSEITAHWGVPHGLINNAALDSPPSAASGENGPFETYPEDSWDKIMEVNAKGVFLSCQIFGGSMAEAGRGSIVNIASIYGMVSPDQGLYDYRRQRGEEFYKPVAYSASKSALYNLTRYLATYWGARGVRVNAVTFGGVFNDQDENFLANYTARVPLGRMASETDYNGAIVFLLSGASAYMTGANLVMDGGWTAW